MVTEKLDWRLHGFDLLSEHQPGPGVEWPLMNAGWMVRSFIEVALPCLVGAKAG